MKLLSRTGIKCICCIFKISIYFFCIKHKKTYLIFVTTIHVWGPRDKGSLVTVYIIYVLYSLKGLMPTYKGAVQKKYILSGWSILEIVYLLPLPTIFKTVEKDCLGKRQNHSIMYTVSFFDFWMNLISWPWWREGKWGWGNFRKRSGVSAPVRNNLFFIF